MSGGVKHRMAKRLRLGFNLFKHSQDTSSRAGRKNTAPGPFTALRPFTAPRPFRVRNVAPSIRLSVRDCGFNKNGIRINESSTSNKQ